MLKTEGEVFVAIAKNRLISEEVKGRHEKAIVGCGARVSVVECDEDDSHVFAKRIFCNREFCPVCSEKGSPLHQRRYGRIWERMQWGDDIPMGEVVLTVPKKGGLRDKLKSQEMLRKFHRAGWDVVHRVFGAEGGLTIVHFYGDRSDDFHPHVNVLFPILSGGAWARRKVLDALRSEWRLALENLTGESVLKVVVHYVLKRKAAYKAHTLKYMSRPTVGAARFCRLSEEEQAFVLELRRFHNFRWWGCLSNRNYKAFLDSLPKQGLNDEDCRTLRAVRIDQGLCPVEGCNGHLRFKRVVSFWDWDEDGERLRGKRWKSLEGGFYQLVYHVLPRCGVASKPTTVL